jgi:acyl-CoA thioester hydrolase
MNTPAGKVLHSFRLPVRWGDMDALGHVNNAEYLRYFEQSRVEWFGTQGVRFTGEGDGPLLLKGTITWLRPIVYPCEIEVRLLAGPVGNTSFRMGGEIVNGRDAAERFTEAEFVLVWTDLATAKPKRVPDRFRAIFESA